MTKTKKKKNKDSAFMLLYNITHRERFHYYGVIVLECADKPGKLELPGGKLKKWEPALVAGLREANEETGLGLDYPKRAISLGDAWTKTEEGQTKRTNLFALRIYPTDLDNIKLSQKEHTSAYIYYPHNGSLTVLAGNASGFGLNESIRLDKYQHLYLCKRTRKALKRFSKYWNK